MSARQENKDFDLEPVRYCPRCYSLQIGYIEGIEDSDYCMKCGCSEITETSIEEWERLYKERYGHRYVERTGNPYKKRIYNMTIQELKTELCKQWDYRKIIERIYPTFPRYYGRTDAILVFFDAIVKDRMVNVLRDILIEKHNKDGREENDEGSEH